LRDRPAQRSAPPVEQRSVLQREAQSALPRIWLAQTGFVLGVGQSAVIADVSEDWTSPIDTKMRSLGGTVYRRAKGDLEDDVWFDDYYIPDSYLYPYEYIPSSYPL
jgi:hypothetical protein